MADSCLLPGSERARYRAEIQRWLDEADSAPAENWHAVLEAIRAIPRFHRGVAEIGSRSGPMESR